jgi:hypothetical protein
MNQLDLLKINVNEHTEKKNGLTYLSWAWAWAEALKADPLATFNVAMFGDKCYMEINGTAMVWVTVTLFGKPIACMLPVMDSSNKPITIAGVTTVNKYGKEIFTILDSFNVNTAIMRCMTKCLALHGLGLYIYAGEDLPETAEVAEGPKEVMGDLMNKEHAPAYKKIVEKHDIPAKKRPQPTEWDNSDASRQLFADGMIKYAEICTTVDDLNSYWMSNQLQLESLKQTHADLFKGVLDHFSTMKKTFTQGTKNV